MFFKKLEAKKEEKEKKEPFEKILLRDKTSSGFYFFWDSFQPPSAFFLWLEIKNQFYSNTLSHDAGNLNFRCNSNVFFFWKEEGISNVEEKELCGEEEITVCARFSSYSDRSCCCFLGWGMLLLLLDPGCKVCVCLSHEMRLEKNFFFFRPNRFVTRDISHERFPHHVAELDQERP
jgi:hypothetical protein